MSDSFATPRTVALYPWDFADKNTEEMLPFPPPGDLPDPGIELKSLALASGFFTTEPPECF